MKTTIDLPDPLYKQAKLRAVERGITLKDMIIEALSTNLDFPAGSGRASAPTWGERRKLLPAYEAARSQGAFRPRPGDRDVTDLISEDRDAR